VTVGSSASEGRSEATRKAGQKREYSSFDVTSHAFWRQPFAERDRTFAQLRRADGLTWHEPLPSLFDLEEPGFWALTRRADIAFVSTHPELFTSMQGVALDPMPAEVQRFASFFLTMDPPQHTVYRRLISSAFTPRNVRRIEEQIYDTAVKVVDDLIGAGEIDFVSACSADTDADHHGRARGSAVGAASGGDRGGEAVRNERRRVQHARGAGVRHHQRDHAAEIGSFLILLASAGNDTTKQATSHAMLALVAHPEQRDWLMEDFEDRIGTAVEEFVRWSSPVLQFARSATEDTELAGQQIMAGDKVGLFYCSANRDESVFGSPGAFDLRRSPNPHLGFGGGGPHFCLGNQLTKSELQTCSASC
jgi:cytochrome P450